MVLKEPFESLTDEERKLFSNYLNYVSIHKSIIILESKMHTKNFLSHTNVYIDANHYCQHIYEDTVQGFRTVSIVLKTRSKIVLEKVLNEPFVLHVEGTYSDQFWHLSVIITCEEQSFFQLLNEMARTYRWDLVKTSSATKKNNLSKDVVRI